MVVVIDAASDPYGVTDKNKSVTDRVDQFTADSDRYNDSAFSTDKRTDWTSGLGPGQKAGEGQTSVSDQLSRRRGTSRGTYSFGRGPTGTTGEVGRTSASAFRGNPYTAYSKRPVVRAEERESGIGPREERKRDEVVRPATRDLGNTPRATSTEFLRPDEVGTSRDTEAMTRKYGENFQETEGYKSEVRAFDYSPEPEVFLASATGRFAGLGTGQNRDETQVANLSNLRSRNEQLYETMDQTGVGEVTDQDWKNRNQTTDDPSAGGTKYFKKGFLPGTGTWEDKEQRTIQHGYDDPATGQTRKAYTEGEYLQEYGYGQYGDATYDRELKESYRRNWEQQNPGQDFDAENLMSQNYTPPEKEFNPRTGPPPIPTKNQKLAYATPDTENISYRYTSDTGGYYNEFGEFIPSLKVNPGDQTAYAGPLEGDTSNKKASSDIAFNSDLDRWIDKTYGGAAANWYRNNPGLPSSSNPYLPAGAYVPQASVEKSDDTLVASSGDLTGLLSEKTAPEVSGDDSWKSELPGWISNPSMHEDGSVWGYNYSGGYGNVWKGGDDDAKHMGQEGTWGFTPEKDVTTPTPWGGKLNSATKEEPFGNYIKNEDTGQVFKLGEGMDTSSTTDLNGKDPYMRLVDSKGEGTYKNAREHNREQGPWWTSGYYRDQSVDNLIRDGYSQTEANRIKDHIAEGDRIESQAKAMEPQIDAAFKEYKRTSDYATNYLGGRTVGTQAEYSEAMRRYAASDAAYNKYEALQQQQMDIRGRRSKHTDALSQYL